MSSSKDDVADTGIAMGTPGDKKEIGQVVQSDIENPPEQDQPQEIPDPEFSIPQALSADFSILQPSSSSAEEMGVLNRLPEFDTFAALDINPSIGAETLQKPEDYPQPFAASEPSTSVILEQATIEDYFAQSKYYPSVSENLETLYPILPSPKATKTFLSLDEPGPSGLQSQKKSKQSSSGLKLKKAKKSQTPRKVFTCQVCQKNFITLEKLNKHQQLHSGTSPFKCEHCKKTFTSKFKLVRHVLIHSESKPFKCTVCERTFHRKDHLKNHIKVHSSIKKIYICEKPDCKKEYTSLMSYKKHLALHAAEEGSLQCQICSSIFQTKDDIMYHLKIHAGSRAVKDPTEKKFTCEHCDRKFFTKKDVRRHLVVHTGMRDFLCQFCPQRFGRKDHLVRHIKKSHSKSMRHEKAETIVKKESAEASTSVAVKTEPESEHLPETEVKSESFAETATNDPFDPFNPLVDMTAIILEPDFQTLPFLDPQTAEPELRDLGSNILEEIGEPSCSTTEMVSTLTNPEEELLGENVMNLPAIRQLLEPTEEKNIPLPGFSETFQSSPPPPQPPP